MRAKNKIIYCLFGVLFVTKFPLSVFTNELTIDLFIVEITATNSHKSTKDPHRRIRKKDQMAKMGI